MGKEVRLRKQFLYTLIAILILIMSILILLNKNITNKGLKIGSKIPSFKYTDIIGTEYFFNKLEYKKLYLCFISIECPSCLKLLKNLDLLSDSFKDEVNFLLLLPKKYRKTIVKFKNNNLYSMMFFVEQRVFNDVFKENIVPKVYFVDESKKIVYKHEGVLTFNDEFKLLVQFTKNVLHDPSKQKLIEINKAKIIYSNDVILQLEDNDCGFAALRMVYEDLGIKNKFLKKTVLSKTNKNGISMLDLKKIAESDGLQVSGWKLTFQDLLKSETPLIALIYESHYVVLSKITTRDIVVKDPAVGTLVYKPVNFFKIWNGQVLKFKKRRVYNGFGKSDRKD